MSRTHSHRRGVSLAKGPVALVGAILLAYGVTGLILGDSGFTTHAVDGTVQGDKWLGLEGNGWTNVLIGGAGALLLLGSPMHWGAKSLSMLVGLALGAAAVIALVDDRMDVLGIFAVNDATILGLGIAGGALLILSLLPRVGRRRREGRGHHERDVERRTTEPRVGHEEEEAPRTSRFSRDHHSTEHTAGSVRDDRIR